MRPFGGSRRDEHLELGNPRVRGVEVGVGVLLRGLQLALECLEPGVGVVAFRRALRELGVGGAGVGAGDLQLVAQGRDLVADVVGLAFGGVVRGTDRRELGPNLLELGVPPVGAGVGSSRVSSSSVSTGTGGSPTGMSATGTSAGGSAIGVSIATGSASGSATGSSAVGSVAGIGTAVAAKSASSALVDSPIGVGSRNGTGGGGSNTRDGSKISSALAASCSAGGSIGSVAGAPEIAAAMAAAALGSSTWARNSFAVADGSSPGSTPSSRATRECDRLLRSRADAGSESGRAGRGLARRALAANASKFSNPSLFSASASATSAS